MTNKNPFYLTKSEAFRYAWLLNFALKLPNYAATFGIPQAWVEEIMSSSAVLDKTMKLIESLRTATTQAVTFKDALFNQQPEFPTVPVSLAVFNIELKEAINSLPNIFSRAISVADMILSNPLSTENIRKDLKLVKPTETEATEATGKQRKPVVDGAPVIKAKVAGDVVTLNIIKGKEFTGLMARVFVNRTDKGEPQYLTSTNTGKVTDRAIFDNGVQFVTYTYQVQMVNGDQPMGDPSATLIVVVQRPLGLQLAA